MVSFLAGLDGSVPRWVGWFRSSVGVVGFVPRRWMVSFLCGLIGFIPQWVDWFHSSVGWLVSFLSKLGGSVPQ